MSVGGCAGSRRRVSGRRGKVQVRKSRLHGLVAEESLLHVPDRVHSRHTGRRHYVLLRERRPRRLASRTRRGPDVDEFQSSTRSRRRRGTDVDEVQTSTRSRRRRGSDVDEVQTSTRSSRRRGTDVDEGRRLRPAADRARRALHQPRQDQNDQGYLFKMKFVHRVHEKYIKE